jgi:hypothetical protein
LCFSPRTVIQNRGQAEAAPRAFRLILWNRVPNGAYTISAMAWRAWKAPGTTISVGPISSFDRGTTTLQMCTILDRLGLQVLEVIEPPNIEVVSRFSMIEQELNWHCSAEDSFQSRNRGGRCVRTLKRSDRAARWLSERRSFQEFLRQTLGSEGYPSSLELLKRQFALP